MKRQQKTAQLEQLSPICGRVKVLKHMNDLARLPNRLMS